MENCERAQRRPPPECALPRPARRLPIGAHDWHQFTVIGDTVNVANRLQQLCHELGCEVVASEATYRLAAERGAVGAAPRSAPVTLRGRDEAVRVFSLR